MNDQDLDQLIKQGLTAEEAAYYDQLDEPDLFNKMALIYTGKMKWITIIQSIAMAGLFAFGVYATIQFYKSDDLVVMLRWGFAGFFAIAATSMVKLFLIMLMQEKGLLRQIKRMELQLSHVVKLRDNE